MYDPHGRLIISRNSKRSNRTKTGGVNNLSPSGFIMDRIK